MQPLTVCLKSSKGLGIDTPSPPFGVTKKRVSPPPEIFNFIFSEWKQTANFDKQ